MSNPGRILIIDDDQSILDAAAIFLRREFSQIITEVNPGKIPEHLKSNIDVILLDMNYSPGRNDGSEGLLWIRKIREADTGIMVIPVTAYGDTDLVVKAMHAGAVDFVVKPWTNHKLLATLNSALALKNSRQEVFKLRSTRQKLNEDMDLPFSHMIGNSVALRRVKELIDKVAGTNANILVLGENGTGKELVARELHRKSARNKEVFIAVDLGSLHEGLFESELFGHTRGSFTDALEDRPGRFELASGGTLFLDEVGNLPLSLQPKLLSVLQNRKLFRVGSNREISIDIRLICATNQSLLELTGKSLFRQDLLFRINTFEIWVPPLRERVEDIPPLLDFYLDVYSRKYNKTGLSITSGTIRALQNYPWPGNVREFHHAVERAVILAESNTLSEKDFSQRYQALSDVRPATLNLAENEKQLILAALEKHGGNISRASSELGLERTALHRRIKKYGF
jgi:DNA-binding NtrC family response regulator